MADIILKRKKEWFNYLRRFKVYLNDDLVGVLYDDESIRRLVQPGKNALQVRMEWCGSPVIHFNIDPEQIKTFEVSSLETSRIINMVTAGLLIFFFLFPPSFLDIPWYFNMMLVIAAILLVIYNMTLGRDRFLEIHEIKMDPEVKTKDPTS